MSVRNLIRHALRFVPVFVLVFACASRVSAQTPPDMWLMAHDDSLLVHIGQAPAVNHGFVVYRSVPGGEEERITPDPILPVRDPAEAAAVLGGDLPRLMDVMDIQGEVALVRRLHSDPFASRAMAVLSRNAAVVAGRFFADPAPPAVPELEYRIVFLDETGAESDEVRTARIRPQEAPAELSVRAEANARNQQVDLRILHDEYQGDPQDLAMAFQVERADVTANPAAETVEAEFRRITDLPLLRASGDATSLVDREALNDRAYRYRVRPVDLAGRVGAGADTEVVVPFDDRPPAAPVRVVTEPEDGAVRIVWTLSPEPSVVGYRLERSTGLDQPYSSLLDDLVPVALPNWTDTTVTGGIQYFYRVVAVNARGLESNPSTPISAMPLDLTPPEAPTTVSYVVTDRRVQLDWDPSPSDDVLGYHVYRGDDPDRVLRLTPEPVPGTDFADGGFGAAGLNPGGTYTYHVSAVDRSYNESVVVVVEVSIPDDEAPAPPSALQLRSVQGRHLEVRWSTGPSLDVVAYRVTRFQGDGTLPGMEIEVAHGRDLLVRDTTGLTPGVSYRYEVVAVDRAGNVGEAATDSVTFVDPSAPPAPRYVEAAAIAGGAGDAASGVRIVWERVIHADLAGYRVYRAPLPTGAFEAVSGLLPPQAPLEFVDEAGEVGAFYLVRAVTSSGTESRASPVARAGS